MKERPTIPSALAAFVASLSTTIFYPLELARVHLAVYDVNGRNNIPKYSNFLHAIQSLYKKNGVSALYRGWQFNIVGSVAWGIYFYIYEGIKQFFSNEFKHSHPEIYKLSVGTAAAVISNVIVSPMFVLKTRVMLQHSNVGWYEDIVEAFRKVRKVDGVRGFWNGLTPRMFLGLNGAVAMYFYESMIDKFQTDSTHLATAVAGGSSRVLASVLFYPLQVVRLKMEHEQYYEYSKVASSQIKVRLSDKRMYDGVWDCVLQTVKNDGFRGLYRGLGATIINLLPASAMFFVIYQGALRQFE